MYDNMKMDGKVVLVTGSTDGIGKQTAYSLASKGAIVLLHGRNSLKRRECSGGDSQHDRQHQSAILPGRTVFRQGYSKTG